MQFAHNGYYKGSTPLGLKFICRIKNYYHYIFSLPSPRGLLLLFFNLLFALASSVLIFIILKISLCPRHTASLLFLTLSFALSFCLPRPFLFLLLKNNNKTAGAAVF